MVNNQHENHTEAHQAESWLAKKKTMVGIGGVLFLALAALLWGVSRNNEPTIIIAKAEESTTRLSGWNKLGIAVGSIVVLGVIVRYKVRNSEIYNFCNEIYNFLKGWHGLKQ